MKIPMSTSFEGFNPCERCGATSPADCRRPSSQDCLLELPLNQRYVCRCCATIVGAPHARFCKEGTGLVTMAQATDKPIRMEVQDPSGVQELDASYAQPLPLNLRRVISKHDADAFMALSDEDKRRVFTACAQDTGDIMSMRSLRMYAVMPRVIPELAMLVRRLAYALQDQAPGHPLAQEAMQHLKENRLDGTSPLKDPAS